MWVVYSPPRSEDAIWSALPSAANAQASKALQAAARKLQGAIRAAALNIALLLIGRAGGTGWVLRSTSAWLGGNAFFFVAPMLQESQQIGHLCDPDLFLHTFRHQRYS